MAVPLTGQLEDPALLIAILLYVPLLWPLIAITRAEKQRLVWIIAGLAAASGVSLWHFTRTPPGIWWMDAYENMTTFSSRQGSFTPILWDEVRAAASAGWSFVPTYLIDRTTGTFLGERLFGFAAHLLLIIATGLTARRAGVPIAVALVACGPTPIWLSRHAEGTEHLLQQITVIAALDQLRRSRRVWLVVVAGAFLGMLSYTYAAARVAWLYPAIWLWRKPGRALAVYAVLAVCLLPIVLVPLSEGHAVNLQSLPRSTSEPGSTFSQHYQVPTLEYAWKSLRSLADEKAGEVGTRSYPGAQTLPTSAVLAGAIGSLAAPRYGIGAAVGTLPDLVSYQNPARSHRQMLVFMPVVLAVAEIGRWLPPLAVYATAVVVAAEGAWRWFDLMSRVEVTPGRWRDSAGYGDLYPCAESPMRDRYIWCP